MRFVGYDVCRLKMFVSHDIKGLITFVTYDVCLSQYQISKIKNQICLGYLTLCVLRILTLFHTVPATGIFIF